MAILAEEMNGGCRDVGPTFASRAYGAFKLLLLSQKKIEHTVQNPANFKPGPPREACFLQV